MTLAVWLLASRAEAQATAGAAKAFAQAQAAELAGKPEDAARFYELAYMLAPTPEALRSAARTRLESGQRALAASHAHMLLRQYASDPKSRAIAQNIMEATQGQLLSVTARCRLPCQIEVDGGVMPAAPTEEHVLYLEPGDHRLAASFDGDRSDTQHVSGGAGVLLSRNFEPPAKPAEPSQPKLGVERSTPGDAPRAGPGEPRERGISRLWFITTACVAVGLAGTVIWSGLDVLNKHDGYKKQPTKDGYDEGVRLERRTNILIGAAAAAGASAAVLAFFTDWSPDAEETLEPAGASVSAGVSRTGASFSITKRF